MQEENKKRQLWKTIFVIISTVIVCLSAIGIGIYFATHKELVIVFYDVEYTTEAVTENYNREYVCAYVRLNAENNHWLNVQDFSILCNGKTWRKAEKAEYCDQIIRVFFMTYLGQPTLKLYFNVNHSEPGSNVTIKFKDTEMEIGEYAKTR